MKESPLVSSVSCSVFRDPELRLWTDTLEMLCGGPRHKNI